MATQPSTGRENRVEPPWNVVSGDVGGCLSDDFTTSYGPIRRFLRQLDYK
jgi:hypothetical protein